MEKQTFLKDIEIEQPVKPVIRKVRNTYVTATGYLIEEVISKKWLLKHLNQSILDA